MSWNPDKQEFEEQDTKVWYCNKLSCTANGENCMTSKCCLEPGMTCFKKNDEWASCNATCNEKMLWNHDKQVLEEQDHKVWDCTALSETPKVVLGEKMWEERYLTHCLELLDVEMNTHMSLKLLSDPHCDNTGHVPEKPAALFPMSSTSRSRLECAMLHGLKFIIFGLLRCHSHSCNLIRLLCV